ncbi:hypothetical protein [Streptomyces sp. NPDC056190]|uniref:hypothetical protein n=1 Tax=Streptomyces sp. NPDC056190 TaxID=3345741 RepID=UPI0035D9F6A6
MARVRRAAWRLEQAEKERDWALASARAGGVSVRKAAKAAGLSPTRVHQLTKDVSADVLEAVLAELRAAGWPAPEDPDGSDDAELPGAAGVGGRLVDEVGWIGQCAERIDHLERKHYGRRPISRTGTRWWSICRRWRPCCGALPTTTTSSLRPQHRGPRPSTYPRRSADGAVPATGRTA